MRKTIFLIALVLCAGLAFTAPKKAPSKAAGKTAAAKKPTAKKGTVASGRSRKKKTSAGAKKSSGQTWRSRQLAPDPGRYRDIQEALIAKGYLQGPATGRWDETSVAALRRFQQEQNLEASGKINSLSLIALGLGPRYDTSAAAAPPAPPTPTPQQP